MDKKSAKGRIAPSQKNAGGKDYLPIKFPYILLLIAYGFVTVVTPNWYSFDSNGPKFMTLSFLNLITFLFLLRSKQIKLQPFIRYEFFNHLAGFSFLVWMVISLLSFVKAWNVNESILHFAKIFTTFSSAYLVSVLLLAEKRGFLFLSVALSLLLIFDSITVFSDIARYTQGKLDSIINIKSVYSNKNILGASIFVKLPFAVWLFIFRKGWLRNLGGIAAFLSMPATFFLSTRTFYYGLIASTILLTLFFARRFYFSHNRLNLSLMGTYLFLFALSLGIFAFTQKFFYPAKKDTLAQGIGTRLISVVDPSGGGRFGGWKRSWHLIKKEPLLGVGLGNWKIATLKEENQTSTNYVYQYKAHNDFIETTTETGIFGGLSFLAIFIFISWEFLGKFRRNTPDEELSYHFLPAFGVFCFAFDAFFNFPQDRPEISALFAILAGAGIAGSYHSSKMEGNQRNRKFTIRYLLPERFFSSSGADTDKTSLSPKYVKNRYLTVSVLVLYFLVMSVSSLLLTWNFKSLRLQRIYREESMASKLKNSSEKMVNGLPPIPDINVVGEPMVIQKARYLINEGKTEEAFKMLKKDKSSPYDGRPEFILAITYQNMGKPDSALAYCEKFYRIKPHYPTIVSLYAKLLESSGRREEALKLIDQYLVDVKNDNEGWRNGIVLSLNTGKLSRADALADSALKYFPADTTLLKLRKEISLRIRINPFLPDYNAAINAYNGKNFSLARSLFDKILKTDSTFYEALSLRAFSHYNLRNYQASINDIEAALRFGPETGQLLNLHGVNLMFLNRKEEACIYFTRANVLKDRDGIANYRKFCTVENR